MQASQIPTKFSIPWGNAAGSGYIRNIPTASQIGITNGAASLTDGFPPLNFLPVGSGGVPPFGQDMNGILKQITQWDQWQAAGGLPTYDSGYSSAIGGYPEGALIASTTPGTLWLCTADNNTTDPDGGSSANWVQIPNINQVLSEIQASTIGIQNVRTFSTVGTTSYTPTSGTRAILVEVLSGGGGGGATNAPGAGGVSMGVSGAAGAYSKKYVVTSGLTFPASIVVGAGGTGGTSSGNGGTGGTSSFTCTGMTTVSCTGGGGGVNTGTIASFPQGTTTASGGTATGGDLNVNGGPSQAGLFLSSTQTLVGLAGSTIYGPSPIQFGITSPGANGIGYGSGATGGLAYGGAGAQNGGTGAQGVVIVTEFK